MRVLSACGWRVVVYTQLGTFDVDDRLSTSDKAALLAAFDTLACDGIPNCEVLWKEDTRRRLGEGGGTMTLVIAMRVVLDKDSPVVPTIVYETKASIDAELAEMGITTVGLQTRRLTNCRTCDC